MGDSTLSEHAVIMLHAFLVLNGFKSYVQCPVFKVEHAQFYYSRTQLCC